jgi:primosomal protein N' (replication factor Y)
MSNPDHKLDIIAEVAVRGLPTTLSYILPASLDYLDVGSEITVPLGKRLEKGWIVSLSDSIQTESSKEYKLKNILQGHNCFNKESIKLFQWMADYYGANLVEAIECATPERLFKKPEFSYHFKANTKEGLEEIIKSLPKSAKTQIDFISNYLDAPSKTILISDLSNNDSHLRALKALEKKGHLEKRVYKSANSEKPFKEPSEINLNEEQKLATDKIITALDQATFKPFLLYGITGSGKTEVYLSAIQEVLKRGGSALVVVPEIALTPQLTGRFESRLGTKIGLLHSKVGGVARWETWEACLNGEIKVAIGARSAIFAPIKNLGLIIVDEEHESSYKQGEGLRYNGRDLAIMKAKFLNIPIILGSATPSFETLYNASRGHYGVLKLTERANKTDLPEIEVVDMRKYKLKELPATNISPILHTAIRETLEKKEQIILFYNKRGFASYLQCESCNRVIECPNCSVTLTYYRYKDSLNCHYCGLQHKAPEKCTACSDTIIADDEKKEKKIGKLTERGSGTEKIHEEIAELFPEASILRMDRDSTTKKDAVENIIDAMHSQSADILVGTQMIAKGHDLPHVTLVGIIDADIGLHFPDFRASERTYQLIVQAAGRAGRGDFKGRVILQTREPSHPTILSAVKNKFQAFAKFELDFRETLSYPPHGRLARLVISSPDNNETLDVCHSLTSFLKHLQTTQKELSFNILGPTKAPIERLSGRYRWHLLIKSKSAKTLSILSREVRSWKEKLKGVKDARVIFDIDPVDML